jgi:HAD superfamily hydrolase (TIGR01549 family)
MNCLPRAILFDMDGTLTVPMLDFPRIKADMGIGERPILEALAEMTHARRKIAEAILHRHEEHAAANSTLNPGCEELLEWLANREIKTALITRNSRASTQTVIERHALKIDILITREDAPHKPDPAPLLLACDKLAVQRNQVWMVGDGQYDIEAGIAAGIRTIWISHGRQREYGAVADVTVPGLPEFLGLLKR